MAQPGERYSLNMISAVNARGHFRFMVHEGRVNAAVFAQFLERLVEGVQRKIILVVDGHSIHRAKLVQHKLIELNGRVALVFLPVSLASPRVRNIHGADYVIDGGQVKTM